MLLVLKQVNVFMLAIAGKRYDACYEDGKRFDACYEAVKAISSNLEAGKCCYAFNEALTKVIHG